MLHCGIIREKLGVLKMSHATIQDMISMSLNKVNHYFNMHVTEIVRNFILILTYVNLFLIIVGRF